MARISLVASAPASAGARFKLRIPEFRLKSRSEPIYHSGIVAPIDNVELERNIG